MCDFSDWEDKRGAELTIASSPPSERNSAAGTSLCPPVGPPSPSSKSLFLRLFWGWINQCTEGLCVLPDLILMFKFMRKGFQPHCNTIIYLIYYISMCIKFKQRLPMCCIILSAPLSKENMCSLCSSFIILVFEPSCLPIQPITLLATGGDLPLASLLGITASRIEVVCQIRMENHKHYTLKLCSREVKEGFLHS